MEICLEGGPTRLGRMLRVIEDQHVTCGSFGCNDARILGHVAGSVHLSLVVDLDFNLNLSAYRSKASKLYIKRQQIQKLEL